MIDWHCHILPGLDDGAVDLETAVAMAAFLQQAGFVEVYCTPHHIFGLYNTPPAQLRTAVAELQEKLDEAGIRLRLHAGMEYYLDEYFFAALADPQPLGDSNRLLVEIPSQADRSLVREGVFHAMRLGLTPLVAHPERSRLLNPQRGSGLLNKILFGKAPRAVEEEAFFEELRTMGCLFQGNYGSFSGYYGQPAQQRAVELANSGCYACFGSDGHNLHMLESSLVQGMDAVSRCGGKL